MKYAKDDSVVVVLSAICGNLLLTIAKFSGWLISRSPSMLAEAIHSFADTANQILLYVGIQHSRSGPSREFPWGQGSSRYLWNLISAVGIFFVGFGVTTYHGISSLFKPHEAFRSELYWLSITILALSFFVEGYVLTIAYKKMKKKQGRRSLRNIVLSGDDPTITAVLLEDSIAVLGVVTALTGLWLSHIYQSHLPDAVASIIIGIFLGIMAVLLAFVNGRLLIGMAVSEEKEKDIRQFIGIYPSVEKVISLKTQILGPNMVKLTAEIEFHGGIMFDRKQVEADAELIRQGEEPLPILVDTIERTVRVVGNEINKLERAIRERFPEISSISLEVY